MSHYNKVFWNREIPWLIDVEVQRKVDGGAFEVVQTLDGKEYFYQDNGIELGKTYTYRVRYIAKNFSLLSNEVTKAFPDSLKIVKGKMKKFSPIYWIARVSEESNACVTSPTDTSILLTCTAKSDLSKVQLVWETTDSRDHASLAYDKDPSYANTTLKFRLSLPTNMPNLADPTSGGVLAIQYSGVESTVLVYLSHYATLVSSTEFEDVYNIELDFGNLKAGVDATENVSPTGILEVILSFPTGSAGNDPYDLTYQSNFLEVSKELSILIDNISITGSNSDVGVNLPVVLKNNLSIGTDYDSDWDLNPKRISKNITSLGYVSGVYHTVGASRCFETTVKDGSLKIIEDLSDTTRVLNITCKVWHDSFCKAMKDANQLPNFRVPIECVQDIANTDWIQVDNSGTFAQDVKIFPVYIFSLANKSVQILITNAVKEFSDLMYNSGLPIRLAIDNPRWSISPNNNLSGYDRAIQDLYINRFDRNPPTINSVFDTAGTTDPNQLAYISFLASALENFATHVKSELLKRYITSQFGVVLSLTDIYTSRPSIMKDVNLTGIFKSPVMDFIGVKCDQAMWDNTPSLANILTDSEDLFSKLSYLKSKTFYMSSYIPDTNTGANYGFIPDSPYPVEVWKRIVGDLKLHADGVTDRFVLRDYSQIMKTSLTYTTNDSFGYFLGGEYYEPYIDDRTYPDSVKRIN